MYDLAAAARNSWLMEPGALDKMLRELPALVRARGWPSASRLEAARRAAAAKLKKVNGKVAVMPVQGVVENRMSVWSYFYGGFSCEAGGRALDAFLSNKDVAAIVLDVDSPGGTCEGVEELAEAIYQARAVKPVYAVANAMACSAAYWIASAASALYCTPSGSVGSVGVYAAHVDYSAALADAGIKVSMIQAGKYKTELSPYAPLSDEARDNLQSSIDALYSRFVSTVARNRGTDSSDVRKNYGQGRVSDARPALAAKMIDGMATLDDVLGKLSGDARAQAGRRTSVEVLRLRHELRKIR